METAKFLVTIDRSLRAIDMLKKFDKDIFWWESDGPEQPDDPDWESPIVPGEGTYETTVELLAPFALDEDDPSKVLSWEADDMHLSELKAAMDATGVLRDYRFADQREVLGACVQHADFLKDGADVLCLAGFWRREGRLPKALELSRHSEHGIIPFLEYVHDGMLDRPHKRVALVRK